MAEVFLFREVKLTCYRETNRSLVETLQPFINILLIYSYG